MEENRPSTCRHQEGLPVACAKVHACIMHADVNLHKICRMQPIRRWLIAVAGSIEYSGHFRSHFIRLFYSNLWKYGEASGPELNQSISRWLITSDDGTQFRAL